jgi:hypothetical protein
VARRWLPPDESRLMPADRPPPRLARRPRWGHPQPPVARILRTRIRCVGTIAGARADTVITTMKLTVGPLPPAVYWRRRAIVLGALLLVVVFFVSMCSGGSGGSNSASGKPSDRPSVTGAPSGDPSVLMPVVGVGGDGGGQGNPSVTELASAPPAGGAPGGTATGAGGQQPGASPCADSDISLTASVTPLAEGYYLSMRVKNTSARACTRDLGSGPQTLQVVNASGATIWTSDLCATAGRPPQPDMRTLGSGAEVVLPMSGKFYWDGTTGKCSGGKALPAGAYQLIAKLDTKFSAPVPLNGK